MMISCFLTSVPDVAASLCTLGATGAAGALGAGAALRVGPEAGLTCCPHLYCPFANAGAAPKV